VNKPTHHDIETALSHGLWLVGEVSTGEGRMLADLATEVCALRALLIKENARMEWLLPKQYSHTTRAAIDRAIENEAIAESQTEAPIW